MKKNQALGHDGVASHSNTGMSVAAPKSAMKPLPKWLWRMRHTLTRRRITGRVAFIVLGILSTAWFVVRVVPKPSRATYPCMQVATPFMSGLVVSLLALLTTVGAFRKAKASLMRSRYVTAACFLLLGFSAVFVVLTHDQPPVYADSKLLLSPNQPVGEARGIFPGRVVWVWDPASTNEHCTNTFGDGWFLPKNTPLDVVAAMMADAVMQLTGKPTVRESWDALFLDFNRTHGKGTVGYADGEKIFIRTNQVSASGGTYDAATFEIKSQSRYGMAETSPQVVLALLRQLVNDCGVRQENISVGDPMKHMYKHVFDMWHNEFPNVVYVDADARLGRTAPRSSSQPVIFYSDRGQVLKTSGTTGSPVLSDYYPTVITEATYIINVPAMKGHARAGVTLTGKLHFGSNLRGSATHLHGGLIAPNKVTDGSTMRTGYGLYRVQVDLMGHKDLGGKTVLFLVDALWGGSEANDPPRKFSMAPFYNDWTSSVFVSQDQVAVESVCFDFLKAEFTSNNPYGSYPQVPGADDYIVQAADPSYWPQGFTYDPENDGTLLSSLGVCEHWNNATDKQYSRNLKTGTGVELLLVKRAATAVEEGVIRVPRSFTLQQNYPNPFNPSTTIRYVLGEPLPVRLGIFDLTGKEVALLVNESQDKGEHLVEWNPHGLPSGAYFYRLNAGNHSEVKKLVLQR